MQTKRKQTRKEKGYKRRRRREVKHREGRQMKEDEEKGENK